MRLDSEFIRLPLSFDVERLKHEVLQFSEYDWDYHPQRYDGNTALSLVSKDGGRSDAYSGAMQATQALNQCPYVKQIMNALGAVIGRSRFMRLAPGKGVPAHSDTDYTWRNRVRIHIPVITDPNIVFSCMATQERPQVSVHKAAGEAWVFDNWGEHAVSNQADIHRIHLVIDTVGSSQFWRLVRQGWDPSTDKEDWQTPVRQVPFEANKRETALQYERFNTVSVRSPDELSALVVDFLAEIQHAASESLEAIERALIELIEDWRGHWALYLDTPEGFPHYTALIARTKSLIQRDLEGVFLQSNGASALAVISNWLELTLDTQRPSTTQAQFGTQWLSTPGSSNAVGDEKLSKSSPIQSRSTTRPHFDRPVFIVAAPRSGSTMLFEALKNNKDLWSIGDEAHQEIELVPELQPRNRDFASNRLIETDFSLIVGEQITDGFMQRLQNSRSQVYEDLPPEFQPSTIRFLEKTPKNALRIPFFKAMYPDAKFVFLHRQAKPNIASMIEAWVSGQFITYKELPDWSGLPWSLLLVDNWRLLQGKSVAEIAAHQWAATNQQILDDLARINECDQYTLSYEELLRKPFESLKGVCEFADIPFGPKMRSFAQRGFPNSKYSLTEPNTNKWKKHEADLSRHEAVYASTSKLLEALHAQR